MTGGNRSKRNTRIRGIIGTMVDPLEPGSTIKTEKVLQVLTKQDRRWGLDAHQVGNLIRQREDLRHIDEGTWEKVSV